MTTNTTLPPKLIPRPNVRDEGPWLLEYRRPFIVAFHLGLVALSAYWAIWLRFDGEIPTQNWEPWVRALPVLLVARAFAFALFGLYQGLWRYASIWDLRRIVIAVVSSSAVFYIVIHLALGWRAYPRAVIIIDGLILILLMGGVRMIRRAVSELGSGKSRRRILIYGAGDAGEMLVRDMRSDPRRPYHPIGFVDDNQSKVGSRIHGVPVLGTRDALPRIMEQFKPDEILLALPGSDPTIRRNVVRALDHFNVPIKTVPTLHDILENRVEISRIRNLSVEDLLSRGPVGLDPAPLRRFLRGRRVLVTGAGGSIGSELSRQIVASDTASLVLLERHENSLYHVVNDLTDRGHGAAIHPIIGDVADAARMDDVMKTYRPEIIFHAAAHKHVPLMESNACEAVKNNVTGTRLLMEAAERHHVDRFILISTDKAVNPSSIMGATKRIAELMLLARGAQSSTSFMAVRFGNVLGSSGSVVPRFLQQIKAGGPVTVTHPEMRRFFMLIPEAVQLVLHAAAHGVGGKLYALEMGDQVKLADMARDLIRLSGFVPEVEIPITFIGLRPGEKMFEELVGPDETSESAGIDKVIGVRQSVAVPGVAAEARMRLEAAAQKNDSDMVFAELRALFPALEVDGAQRTSIDETAGVTWAPLTDPAGVAPGGGHSCPKCKSARVHLSRPRSRIEQWLKPFSPKRLYRCGTCQWRGWLVPLDMSGANPLVGEDLISPDLAAIDRAALAIPGEEPSRFAPRDLP